MAESKDSMLTGVRVLIVDDDADTRDLFIYILTSHGATVRTADSASAALELFSSERFDVLTIDASLPDQSGWNLLETIRQMPPEQGGLTPSVAITAFAYPEDVARSLASGFAEHLSKPVPVEVFVSTIARLAGRARNHSPGG